MLSKTIRKNFVDYFKSHGHRHIPSSSVVPHEDPTLLFINAGMNQFKDVFLGRAFRDYTKAVTVQKCIRVGGKHNDLENVGHTTRHMTFFEMLGNFSFGDYFKKEAIQFAWEVTTNVFGFDPEKIWVSVFTTDDEAFELWKQHIKESHIIRLGEKDNFWAMGDTGPCGPCTELLYDRGAKFGNATSPLHDQTGERFLEFWNLVFMQFNRSASGEMAPLPKPCVDTGAGFERILSLKEGVESVFQTEILQHLIREVEKISGKTYSYTNQQTAPAFHVIADHIRMLAFAMADGAIPSNIDRGYVLRKVLRRAVRYAKSLGIQDPFLGKLLPTLIHSMGDDYPELVTSQKRTEEILFIEEESFFKTLKRGGNILSQIIEKASESSEKKITGEDAFKLKDTYGLPLEEVLLLAKDSSMSVDLSSFEALEKEAKERSRKAQGKVSQEVSQSIYEEFVKKHGKCEFVGFSALSEEGSILGIVKNGQYVDRLSSGEEGILLLSKTPFYAEKGGQVGDVGEIRHHKALFKVADCISPYPDVIAHVGVVEHGDFLIGEPIQGYVNETHRHFVERHHSATHLLHFALTQLLGSHVKQAGSLVGNDILRFDFHHHKALSNEELHQIENLVNQHIWDNAPINTYEVSYEEAQKDKGIKQFFGDKYGAVVRVVDMGGYSKELCGGCHVSQLSHIGFFKIKKESSISAGIRRIEAVCHLNALSLVHEEETLLDGLSSQMGAPRSKIQDALNALQSENKSLHQKIERYEQKEVSSLAHSLRANKQHKGSVSFIITEVSLSPKSLPLLANLMMEKGDIDLVLIAQKEEGKCQLLLRIGPSLVQKGIKASDWIKEIAPIVGGSGGGKPDSAQAGGKSPENLHEALNKAKEMVQSKC